MTDRTITDISVFPQDWGVRGETTPGGDPNSAAEFAAFAHAIGAVDVVTTGMSLTVSRDSNGNPDLEVTGGKAVVTAPSATRRVVDGSTSGYSDEEREEVAFVAEVGTESGIGLVDDTTNYIYIDVDETSEDTATIRTDDTDPPATLTGDSNLKIGLADTGIDEAFPTNRFADTDRGMTSSIAQSHGTHIPAGETKHVESGEHMQLTLPRDVEFTIDGELRIDGSFLLLHV
jgi:hypothetical protein